MCDETVGNLESHYSKVVKRGEGGLRPSVATPVHWCHQVQDVLEASSLVLVLELTEVDTILCFMNTLV